jgi:enterochelin esterase-like enzyme
MLSHSSRFARGACVAACLVLVAGIGSPLAAQSGAALTGTMERVTVHGKALAGNLEGNSPDRDVFVYLPPSYTTAPDRRYPVVYLLHGYGLTAERWVAFTDLAGAADRTIAAGRMREMILVSPDAFTVHGGSMYSSSPTIGDWETFLAEDLVSYVDGRYRTIADRASRGLGGHSMGGYGTLRVGMKRPDVYSAIYSMAACCLMNTPAAGGGGRGAGAGRGAAPTGAGRGAAAQPGAAAADGQAGAPQQGAALQAGQAARGQGPAAGRGGRGGGMNVQFGLYAAWSPNPGNPPLYFDPAVVDGQVQPLVAAKMAANSPLVMIDQYVFALRRHRIAIDVGEDDTLAASNRDLTAALTRLGVEHTFEVHPGDHTSHVAERIEQAVLPFFSTALAFPAR